MPAIEDELFTFGEPHPNLLTTMRAAVVTGEKLLFAQQQKRCKFRKSLCDLFER